MASSAPSPATAPSSAAAISIAAPSSLFGVPPSPSALSSSASSVFGFGPSLTPAYATLSSAPLAALSPGSFAPAGSSASGLSSCIFGVPSSPTALSSSTPSAFGFGPAVTPAYGTLCSAPLGVGSSAFGAPSRSPFGSAGVHSAMTFGPAPPASSSAFGELRAASSAFGSASSSVFGDIRATSSGFGSGFSASSPFTDFRAAQPFGGWTGGALSSSLSPSLFSHPHFFGPANPNPNPSDAPRGWFGGAVDFDEGIVSVSALGLKDSHEELRWRYYQERMKEIEAKNNSSATKIITISLEDRPKQNCNFMTAPFLTYADQKLPIVDNVAEHSFMMGDHKVTIRIDGPGSDGAAAKSETLLPKLSNTDYFTFPRIQELAARERLEPGYLTRVRDFVVGRLEYGSVMFPGETDVRGLELDSIVQFNSKEVVLYPDGKTPPVGLGLNKPGVVTLLNVKYYDGKGEQFKNGPIVEKIKDLLMKTASEKGAEFLSYDAASGVWKFSIKKCERSGLFSSSTLFSSSSLFS